MRKSKFLIAGVASAALALGFSSIANAAIFQGQSLEMSASSGKLDKKKPGPLNSFTTDVITSYDNTTPAAPDVYATNTKVYFPKDYQFNTSGLAQCENSASFASGTTANAISLCGPAQVSSAGSATLEGPVPGVTAVLTAFNGQPNGGNPTILLHSQSSAGPSLVLVGTLKASDTAGYGKMLDVPVDLGPFQGTEAITDFKVTIKKTVVGGKASASKKKKKAKKYYIMAKCSKKKWSFRAVSTYQNASTTTADDTISCKQAKSKKKKK